MKDLFKSLMLIPKTVTTLLVAIHHGSHALKSVGLYNRAKNDLRLYKLLKNKETLTKEEKEELDILVKEYKKTL